MVEIIETLLIALCKFMICAIIAIPIILTPILLTSLAAYSKGDKR